MTATFGTMMRRSTVYLQRYQGWNEDEWARSGRYSNEALKYGRYASDVGCAARVLAQSKSEHHRANLSLMGIS